MLYHEIIAFISFVSRKHYISSSKWNVLHDKEEESKSPYWTGRWKVCIFPRILWFLHIKFTNICLFHFTLLSAINSSSCLKRKIQSQYFINERTRTLKIHSSSKQLSNKIHCNYTVTTIAVPPTQYDSHLTAYNSQNGSKIHLVISIYPLLWANDKIIESILDKHLYIQKATAYLL